MKKANHTKKDYDAFIYHLAKTLIIDNKVTIDNYTDSGLSPAIDGAIGADDFKWLGNIVLEVYNINYCDYIDLALSIAETCIKEQKEYYKSESKRLTLIARTCLGIAIVAQINSIFKKESKND